MTVALELRRREVSLFNRNVYAEVHVYMQDVRSRPRMPVLVGSSQRRVAPIDYARVRSSHGL